MNREEAIKELSYIADEMPSMECADWKKAIYMAIEALEQEPKIGHWINKKCSACGCRSMLGLCIENYCANCGAKMQEVEE